MLIKEYRIGLPMSVEEYRIAQLYMIQKKSRNESQGAGSGVEIIVNEPYNDGPGGSGQYTNKIYHIGSHLPGWFRAILPKSALRVEEEAWNAYPYTKTRYRCPFIEKFLLEIETKYLNDGGEQQNVFNLSNADIQQRTVDYLDIVKDPISSGDYNKEEDPKIYVSKKTGRGPLTDSWRDEYVKASRDPNVKGYCVMTAYKLCRVEFRYWGMQNKIERFIYDIGLRKTMLRAHRQAWCWQDEWHGLEIDDIRRLEFETQKALAEKMANANDSEVQSTDSIQKNKNRKSIGKHISVTFDDNVHISESMSNGQIDSAAMSSTSDRNVLKTQSLSSLGSFCKDPSTSFSNGEVVHDWRFGSLEKLQEFSSDDEFFDAQEDMMGEPAHLIRSSSMEFESTDDEYADAVSRLSEAAAIEETPFDRTVEHFRQQFIADLSSSTDTTPPSTAGCRTNILFLVLHGGSLLESSHDNISKRSDFSTIKSTFGNVIRTHYPAAIGHITFRLVSCPPICSESLRVLSSLSPFSFDSPSMKSGTGSMAWSHDFVPLGAIALFASSNPDHQDHVNTLVTKANYVYQEFLSSEKGKGFTGQVCILADATGSILTYDALCQTRPQSYRESSKFGSHSSLENLETIQSSGKIKSVHEGTSPRHHIAAATRQLSQSNPDLSDLQSTTLGEDLFEKQLSKSDIVSSEYKLVRQPSAEKTAQVQLNVCDEKTDLSRRISDGSHYEGNSSKFDFDVSDCFFFGSPLGLILAYRRLYCGDDSPPLCPACHQVYNLFHSSDPMAIRIEPLLHNGFKHISAVKIPRFNKFPLGDWESCHVVEAIQSNIQLFSEHHHGNHTPLTRQESVSSVGSQTSGIGENTVASIANVTSKWWGTKRLDYVLYCPEVLHSFPVNALPHLFHASFWESTDVVAFVLRQLLRIENYQEEIPVPVIVGDKDGERLVSSTEAQPKEKWLKRKTTLKVRNLNPNHRANDVIVLEDKPQILTARFMYGSLDVTSLSGEKVDVHIMEQPSGEWQYMGTDLTDSHGRLSFTLLKEKRQSQGMHSVKMVVRGDHSTTDFFLTVLPPKTETVVFSIDGSFTASMSIMGKDPKVRAGAVDVVRHWQDLGYLILYVTARPDLQHRKVVAWLAQHNFPHGMVAFMDGFSKEPIKQKMYFLKSLMQEAELVYKASYGSSKDIHVYKELGLKPAQMFIVGKAAKKLNTQAQILSEGYATHLTDLSAPGGSRQAVGNARMFLRKSCFGLPVQTDSKKLLKRTTSNQSAQTGSDFVRLSRMDSRLSHPQITVSDSGNTLLEPGQSKYDSATRARGASPRLKMPLNQNL